MRRNVWRLLLFPLDAPADGNHCAAEQSCGQESNNHDSYTSRAGIVWRKHHCNFRYRQRDEYASTTAQNRARYGTQRML